MNDNNDYVEHIDDDLPLVLTGEADRATVNAVVAHLRGCPDCVQELISLLVAHASLASASRFAPEVVARFPSSGESTTTTAPRATPDLSELFAQVNSEAEAEAESDELARRRVRTGLPHRTGRWLAAAAAVVIIGGGTAAIVTHESGSASTTNVALSAYGVGTKPAEAVLTGTQMKLDATSLPAPATGDLYEVWLTNSARTSMHALGWVGTDGTGVYTVPAELMGHFNAIEVSVQKVAGPDKYSGTSVLRGTYS